jgi:paraquat-inducible protein A
LPPLPTRIRECHGCGLFQQAPPTERSGVANCPRCGTELHRHRVNPQGRALALAVTGLMLFTLASWMTFLTLDVKGREQTTWLLSGPVELDKFGMWELAIPVLAFTVLAPLAKLLALAYVLTGLRLRSGLGLKFPLMHLAFRCVELLTPWAMVEVFLLGVFVAYTKLVDIAPLHVGGAVYALAALMVVMAAADSVLDRDEIWESLERAGATYRPMSPDRPPPRALRTANLLACHCCALVIEPRAGSFDPTCPRCGTALHRRKPQSLARSVSLLVAAAILYIPANMLPVMTVISFGKGSPSTILGGVEELAEAGMWPLAALVFFASITVPVLKLAGMIYLLVSTRLRSRSGLRQKTKIYRIVEMVGRWSMIDVFMISILTAILRIGAIASVYPGPGAVSFCAVVILTMLAAMSFDPRLMWDSAEAAKTQTADAPGGAIPAIRTTT